MKQLNNITFRLKIKTLFSSKLILTGLFIILIPTMILVVLLPNIDYHGSQYNSKSTRDTKGILLSVRETNNSVNGKRTLEYDYEFYLESDTVKGQSYGYEKSLNKGDTVDIEYLINESSISRIKGSKNGAFDSESLGFLLGFMFFGLGVLIIPIYKRIGILKTLKTGFEILPSKLLLEVKTPTLPIGNINPYYRLKFEYNISNYTYERVVYTSRNEDTMRRIRMSSIIVDSLNHSKSFILETLPIDMRNYITENSTIANTAC